MVFFRHGFHAQYHVAVHLHEAAVGVPREARIARALGHGLHGLVVHAQVEDRVHHAGHRGAGARADRNQQRHLLVAEAHARQALDVLHRFLHFGAQHLDDGLLAVLVVFGAHLRGDGEARRYGNADQVHFCQVGTFAAEQFTHLAVSFGFLVAEGVDSFDVCHKFFFLCCEFCFRAAFFRPGQARIIRHLGVCQLRVRLVGKLLAQLSFVSV